MVILSSQCSCSSRHARRPEPHANWIGDSDKLEETTEGGHSRVWTSVSRASRSFGGRLLHRWKSERDRQDEGGAIVSINSATFWGAQCLTRDLRDREARKEDASSAYGPRGPKELVV